MNALAAAIQQGIAARPADAPPTQPARTYDDPTAEKIMEDLQSGNADSLRKILANERQRMIDQVIIPMQTNGYENNAAVAKRNALADPAMPHFKRFEHEIADVMKSLDPSQRANYLSYQTAYHIVVGQNQSKLQQEAVEAAIRAKTEEAAPTLPNGQPKPVTYAPGVKSVGDLLGRDAEEQLKAMEWTPDQYAQKIFKVKDWATAAERIQKFNESQGAHA